MFARSSADSIAPSVQPLRSAGVSRLQLGESARVVNLGNTSRYFATQATPSTVLSHSGPQVSSTTHGIPRSSFGLPPPRPVAQSVDSSIAAKGATPGMCSGTAFPGKTIDMASATPVQQNAAKDAIVDWMETHGGKIVVSGPDSNLRLLADSIAWGQRFHPAYGRLLQFLRQHGECSTVNPNVILSLRH